MTDSPDVCAICLDALSSGAVVRKRCCHQPLHRKCSRAAFRRDKRCPLCRAVPDKRQVMMNKFKKMLERHALEAEDMYHQMWQLRTGVIKRASAEQIRAYFDRIRQAKRIVRRNRTESAYIQPGERVFSSY